MPSSLGGPHGTERLEGYLCPTCDRAVREAGAIGPSAMQRSLMLHLGVRQRSLAAVSVELDGVVGWVALTDPAPNTSPWAHLANLHDVRRMLEG